MALRARATWPGRRRAREIDEGTTWDHGGTFDILVEVVCEDDDHLLRLLAERIRGLPGIRDTETFVYLKLTKQSYAWGTR